MAEHRGLTYKDVRVQAHTEVEGFLQLILTTETLTLLERKAYNRMIKFVRKQAGIPHVDIEHRERVYSR